MESNERSCQRDMAAYESKSEPDTVQKKNNDELHNDDNPKDRISKSDTKEDSRVKERLDRPLVLEERHSLSNAETKKRRARVFSSQNLFIPKELARGEVHLRRYYSAVSSLDQISRNSEYCIRMLKFPVGSGRARYVAKQMRRKKKKRPRETTKQVLQEFQLNSNIYTDVDPTKTKLCIKQEINQENDTNATSDQLNAIMPLSMPNLDVEHTFNNQLQCEDECTIVLEDIVTEKVPTDELNERVSKRQLTKPCNLELKYRKDNQELTDGQKQQYLQFFRWHNPDYYGNDMKMCIMKDLKEISVSANAEIQVAFSAMETTATVAEPQQQQPTTVQQVMDELDVSEIYLAEHTPNIPTAAAQRPQTEQQQLEETISIEDAQQQQYEQQELEEIISIEEEPHIQFESVERTVLQQNPEELHDDNLHTMDTQQHQLELNLQSLADVQHMAATTSTAAATHTFEADPPQRQRSTHRLIVPHIQIEDMSQPNNASNNALNILSENLKQHIDLLMPAQLQQWTKQQLENAFSQAAQQQQEQQQQVPLWQQEEVPLRQQQHASLPQHQQAPLRQQKVSLGRHEQVSLHQHQHFPLRQQQLVALRQQQQSPLQAQQHVPLRQQQRVPSQHQTSYEEHNLEAEQQELLQLSAQYQRLKWQEDDQLKNINKTLKVVYADRLLRERQHADYHRMFMNKMIESKKHEDNLQSQKEQLKRHLKAELTSLEQRINEKHRQWYERKRHFQWQQQQHYQQQQEKHLKQQQLLQQQQLQQQQQLLLSQQQQQHSHFLQQLQPPAYQPQLQCFQDTFAQCLATQLPSVQSQRRLISPTLPQANPADNMEPPVAHSSRRIMRRQHTIDYRANNTAPYIHPAHSHSSYQQPQPNQPNQHFYQSNLDAAIHSQRTNVSSYALSTVTSNIPNLHHFALPVTPISSERTQVNQAIEKTAITSIISNYVSNYFNDMETDDS